MSRLPKSKQIPYGRQCIEDDDIDAVVKALQSNWLTTGPGVRRFESAVAERVGTRHAVAVNSGTAALHCAMNALEIGPGDEVIVPAITFASTANCVVFQGGTPVFADVDPDTLLIDLASVTERISKRTRAIISVDYAGQPCDYDALQEIAGAHRIHLVADACHAMGGTYKDRQVGSLAELNVFSFHPVKHITTGEGGMVTTDGDDIANKILAFRNHGITSDHHQRQAKGSWYYEMTHLGYNYRITDIQCALGTAQLNKLDRFVAKRREIAGRYDAGLRSLSGVLPLANLENRRHAYHLYVIRLDKRIDRDNVFRRLREEGVGVNVHYIPVHFHPFYQEKFGTEPGMCPKAETAYRQILSLPVFPDLTAAEVDHVIEVVHEILQAF